MQKFLLMIALLFFGRLATAQTIVKSPAYSAHTNPAIRVQKVEL